MEQSIDHPLESLKSLHRIDFKQQTSRLRATGELC